MAASRYIGFLEPLYTRPYRTHSRKLNTSPSDLVESLLPLPLPARLFRSLTQPPHPTQSLESKPRHIPNASLYLALVSRKTARHWVLFCKELSDPSPALHTLGTALPCFCRQRSHWQSAGSLPHPVHTGFQSSSISCLSLRVL